MIRRLSREPTTRRLVAFRCCDGIVKANIQRRLEGNEENADLELKDLENLRVCDFYLIFSIQLLS